MWIFQACYITGCKDLRPLAFEVLRRRPFPARCCTASRHVWSMSNIEDGGVRINKCLKAQFSRREADALVDAGRVKVNGAVAMPGARVRSGDSVTLDGSDVEWERLLTDVKPEKLSYIKYHKPLDVESTTAAKIPNNIITSLRDAGYDGGDRVFPVGRLDENTSGLILLTNDGDFANNALGARSDCQKEYVVKTDKRVADDHMEMIRSGVVIKTYFQHRPEREPFVAPTKPCVCERYIANDPLDCRLRIVLVEGRNRQIRRMLSKVGNYTIRSLKRISFMGINLDGIEEPNSWAYLSGTDLALIRSHLGGSGEVRPVSR